MPCWYLRKDFIRPLLADIAGTAVLSCPPIITDIYSLTPMLVIEMIIKSNKLMVRFREQIPKNIVLPYNTT